jgi:hypothetical protein
MNVDPKQAAMSTSATELIDLLYFVVAFTPLVPVVLIFLQKKYVKESLVFLMVICIANFIENMVLLMPGTNPDPLRNMFSLAESCLVILTCARELQPPPGRAMHGFLLAFLAASVTFYSIKGINEPQRGFWLLQYLVVILAAGIMFFDMLGRDDVFMHNHPMTWFAAGTIFYFVTVAIVDLSGKAGAPIDDRNLMLTIASFARYFLYSVAVVRYGGEQPPGSDLY